MERRNNAGRVAYKFLENPWSGSEEDNFFLLDLLDQLRTNPGLLSSDTFLPNLNDELAPVSTIAVVCSGGRGGGAPCIQHQTLPALQLSMSW